MNRIRSALTIVAVALAGCGGGSEPSAPTNNGGTTGPAGATGPAAGPISTNQVSVGSASFDPSSIVVTTGTTVTWTWTTPVTHNVTFNATGLGGSGDLGGTGSTYSKTFSTVGTFGYQCTIHSGMVGTVKVE
jgi:plastocyanin